MWCHFLDKIVLNTLNKNDSYYFYYHLQRNRNVLKHSWNKLSNLIVIFLLLVLFCTTVGCWGDCCCCAGASCIGDALSASAKAVSSLPTSLRLLLLSFQFLFLLSRRSLLGDIFEDEHSLFVIFSKDGVYPPKDSLVTQLTLENVSTWNSFLSQPRPVVVKLQFVRKDSRLVGEKFPKASALLFIVVESIFQD